MKTKPVPAGLLSPGDFTQGIAPEDLVHFVLNVGDGDAQLLLLPESHGQRQAIVVDVCSFSKLESLVAELVQMGLLALGAKPFALIVATHPHADHIKGMASFLSAYGRDADEFWEPGYYLATPTYFRMMDAMAALPLRHSQPTSGSTRFIGQVKVTVLAPGVSLKNQYDSYGIDANNSSIAIKIDFPASRYYKRADDRSYEKLPGGATLILGADAQTRSWSQVEVDFPQLGPDKTLVSEALRKSRGVDPLKANVFKVPHHASKHGLNLELVENINPLVSLVSSVGSGGSYGFPHLVSLEALREGLQATTQKNTPRKPDWELGIHYTFDTDDSGKPEGALGSIGVVVGPSGRKLDVWRFGDAVADPVDLKNARRMS